MIDKEVYDLTQTGDEVQAILNNAEGMPTPEQLSEAFALKANVSDVYTKNETYTKSEVNRLVGSPEQNYVTVDDYASLPATGRTDTIYRVANYDGENEQVDVTKYSEYAWNGTSYTLLCVKSQIGEVFDISDYNDATYANLSAALGADGANVPQSIRRGGMSIKFIQSSDNKYIRYNLIADEFTTDVTKWAIAEEGVYVENPEFVYVKTDAKGRILWAIKANGSIYYGAGVPQQVIDYIEERIASLSLDEYEDIVAFLNDIEKGDKTLQTLLNEKVDKEEGKSLIPSQYIQEIESSEFIHVETDNVGRILGGRKVDGSKFEIVRFETPSISIGGQVTKHYTDKEDRIDLNIDSKGRIFSYRDKDGVLHENAGLFVKGMDIPAAIKELQKSSPDLEQAPRFIQISDPHCTDVRTDVQNGVDYVGRMALLAGMIDDQNKKGNLDFVICTGDCCLPYTIAHVVDGVNTPTRDHNLDVFKELVVDTIQTVFIPVVGNHDGYTDEEWYDAFKMPKQFSAAIGDCYLIVLDVYKNSPEWNYKPSHPEADEKGYVLCSVLDEEGINHGRDFRFTAVDTVFLEEQLQKCKRLKKTPIVCFHTFDTASAVDENAANTSVSSAISLMNTYGCKLILCGHSHQISNAKNGNQWRCNPGWFGPINDYNYNVSPWAINLFENVGGYFAVNNIILGHDYPDSNPEYHYLPGGAIGHIEASETITNLWKSDKVRSMFNY